MVPHTRYSHDNIGSDGSSVRLTGSVAVFHPVFGVPWKTCQRVWIKHTSKRCWASIRRNENTRNDCSSASWCPFAHFMLRSSRIFLQSSSTRPHRLHLTKICDHWMQKRRYCPHVLVLSPSSIGKANKLYNSRIFQSRST